MPPPSRSRHCGLTIACNVPLPLPTAAVGPADVEPADVEPADVEIQVVRSQERPHADRTWTPLAADGAWRAPGTNGSRLRLLLEGLDGTWAEFLIDAGGAAVWVTLSEDSNLADAAELMTGSVF